MNTNICPLHEKCPFFNGDQKDILNMDILRQVYCYAGSEGRNRCKRFKIFQMKNSCPENVLPNSADSVEEITENM